MTRRQPVMMRVLALRRGGLPTFGAACESHVELYHDGLGASDGLCPRSIALGVAGLVGDPVVSERCGAVQRDPMQPQTCG
jgi:hypothetical protein